MSGSNNSGSNTSKMAVPQAKEAMNRFTTVTLLLHRQEASAARWSKK